VQPARGKRLDDLIDRLLAKFGIALSSASDFEIKSPTVAIPARLRQL